MKNLFLILPLFFPYQMKGQSNIQISSDFPGGNIIVTKISSDTIWLEPDLAFTEGEWFYWYFKASNTAGKQITFQFNKNNLFAKYGPAYSINNDHTWNWYGENRVQNNSFTFVFGEQDTTAYFGVAFPYTEKNLNEFLLGVNNKESLLINTLCVSAEKRPIEKISILPSRAPVFKVLVTARHHACETMANYVLEGLIYSILNEKNLAFLRDHVEFMFVPFMDKDGVENGEQGKNRIPRDHNRDYDKESIYSSTGALRTIIPEWSDQKLRIALDLHCPWIKGDGNEHVYLVGNQDKPIEINQKMFSGLLEKYATGDIRYYHRNFLPYGVSWNTDKNYHQGMSFARWANSLNGISFASTLEFPYASVSGTMVSKDGARVFGKAIAYAIKEYLEGMRQE